MPYVKRWESGYVCVSDCALHVSNDLDNIYIKKKRGTIRLGQHIYVAVLLILLHEFVQDVMSRASGLQQTQGLHRVKDTLATSHVSKSYLLVSHDWQCKDG